MKRLFSSIIFMFAGTLLWAQSTNIVKYVSFFPPAHITHSEVLLTQNEESFNYSKELSEQTNTGDYHAKSGGLVLGAAKDAEVTVNQFRIAGVASAEDKLYAIKNFMVENLIEVSSFGQIGSVYVGVPCAKGESTECQTSFLSANKFL